MPSLKAIRKRIASVKNTQKITGAMKLVAAARLRRAQDAIIAARPYARELEQVIGELATRAGRDAHPLLIERPLKRVELIVMSSDRGLAGSFNSQLFRATERYAYEHAPEHDSLSLVVVGRKGRDYFRRRKLKIARELGGVQSSTCAERAEELVAAASDDFVNDRVDGVFLIYNEFKSAISQKVQVERLFPIVPRALPAGAAPGDFVYEPSQTAVLDTLLPLYARTQVGRALLESVASELGARMSAMDNAASNAKAMIGRLTLDYNRARQAAITKELLEIVGGAEALKG